MDQSTCDRASRHDRLPTLKWTKGTIRQNLTAYGPRLSSPPLVSLATCWVLVLPPLSVALQRHGAHGQLLVEMDGGFRALQLKKSHVSDMTPLASQRIMFCTSNPFSCACKFEPSSRHGQRLTRPASREMQHFLKLDYSSTPLQRASAQQYRVGRRWNHLAESFVVESTSIEHWSRGYGVLRDLQHSDQGVSTDRQFGTSAATDGNWSCAAGIKVEDSTVEGVRTCGDLTASARGLYRTM